MRMKYFSTRFYIRSIFEYKKNLIKSNEYRTGIFFNWNSRQFCECSIVSKSIKTIVSFKILKNTKKKMTAFELLIYISRAYDACRLLLFFL